MAWQAVGCGLGAYEHALAYAKRREQFGKPIGAFQLVQDLLVRMLANITASQTLVMRLLELQDAGIMDDHHAALAKAFCTVKTRETVGWARELLGGNGILLEENVGRFVVDAEAIYSYEGTRELKHPHRREGDHRAQRLRVTPGVVAGSTWLQVGYGAVSK